MYKMLVKIKCDVFISLKEEKKDPLSHFFLLWIKRWINTVLHRLCLEFKLFCCSRKSIYLLLFYTSNNLNQSNQLFTRKVFHADSLLRPDAATLTRTNLCNPLQPDISASSIRNNQTKTLPHKTELYSKTTSNQ